MTAPALTLPPQMNGGRDVRGWLCFTQPLDEPWQSYEDSTAECDRRNSVGGRRRERDATSCERSLLEALGYNTPPQLVTVVEYPSPAVRRRTWPALEGQTP